MFFSLFPKTASSSVFIVDEDSVLIATEPHFGQRAGALGIKPPSITVNSCPQEGHFALENPVSIVSSLLCFTASNATGIVHTVLHQLAAGEHGHRPDEQFDRKFQKILSHKP